MILIDAPRGGLFARMLASLPLIEPSSNLPSLVDVPRFPLMPRRRQPNERTRQGMASHDSHLVRRGFPFPIAHRPVRHREGESPGLKNVISVPCVWRIPYAAACMAGAWPLTTMMIAAARYRYGTLRCIPPSRRPVIPVRQVIWFRVARSRGFIDH